MSSKKWTISNIPDLSKKAIIVTGGNSGLGYESVKAFASKGAKVVMACRTVSKGEEARSEILTEIPDADIHVMELDLMSLGSIRVFASKFKKAYSHLDILLNNAGIMMVPYGLTKDGFERQMGTNHLGHFALTCLLVDLLKKTPKSRVVNVSSMAHKQGVMDFDNFLFPDGNGYSSMKAYGRSKLANLLFTYELQHYFESNKYDCMAVAAHPGVSNTNLANHLIGKVMFKILSPLMRLFFQNAAQGALPQIRAAVDLSVEGGDFYGPDGYREMKGSPVLVESNEASYNAQDAVKLWQLSEKLTGVTFP